jgi:protein-disulfide isomerase
MWVAQDDPPLTANAPVDESLNVGENPHYADIPSGGVYADAREVERGEDVAEGEEQGINEEGIPYIGDPDAPIVIAEFLDFTCPHCMNYAPTVEQIIDEYARTGMVMIELYPIPAQSRAPASTNAARAALCAGVQGGFWEYHDELFRIHSAENGNAFSSLDRIESIGDDIGLDGAEIRSCVNTNTPDAGLLTTQRLATEYQVDSIPTIIWRAGGSATWNTMPTADGQTGGGRSFEDIARLIESANS